MLTEKQPRDDYKELLELTLVFLEETPKKPAMFRAPGAVHHARWMAKAIYSLKMFLFREEFELSKQEENDLGQICVFIVTIYVEAWFSCTLPIHAPYNDFLLLQNVHHFKSVDKDLSRVAIQKLQNHLWYLNPENVALAFFDQRIPNSTKAKMVEALKNVGDIDQNIKRPIITNQNILTILENGIEQFVSMETKLFFERFKVDQEFLKSNSADWEGIASFIEAKEIIGQLRVVNDTAERGVKLMEEYNSLITKDEEQKQYVLQVVQGYRRKYSGCIKKALIN